MGQPSRFLLAGGLAYWQHNMGRMPPGSIDALRCDLEIFCLCLEDIGHKLLRIAVDEWEPCALDLNADSVALQEDMVRGVKIDTVLHYAVTRYWFWPFKALSETATKNLVRDDKLVSR